MPGAEMPGGEVRAPSEQLAALGLELPSVPTPLAAYVPAVRFGDAVHTSGQVPLKDGQLLAQGVVGTGADAVSPEQARACARQCALNALAAVAAAAGGIDEIARVVKMVVYVASEPGFTGQPQIADGASELIGALFGEQGRHARSAVGVAVLPINAPVEVELIAEIVSRPRVVDV